MMHYLVNLFEWADFSVARRVIQGGHSGLLDAPLADRDLPRGSHTAPQHRPGFQVVSRPGSAG
jgi:hypothetical protein